MDLKLLWNQLLHKLLNQLLNQLLTPFWNKFFKQLLNKLLPNKLLSLLRQNSLQKFGINSIGAGLQKLHRQREHTMHCLPVFILLSSSRIDCVNIGA